MLISQRIGDQRLSGAERLTKFIFNQQSGSIVARLDFPSEDPDWISSHLSVTGLSKWHLSDWVDEIDDDTGDVTATVQLPPYRRLFSASLSNAYTLPDGTSEIVFNDCLSGIFNARANYCNVIWSNSLILTQLYGNFQSLSSIHMDGVTDIYLSYLGRSGNNYGKIAIAHFPQLSSIRRTQIINSDPFIWYAPHLCEISGLEFNNSVVYSTVTKLYAENLTSIQGQGLKYATELNSDSKRTARLDGDVKFGSLAIKSTPIKILSVGSTILDDRALENTDITSLVANNCISIGISALNNSHLFGSIELPEALYINDAAFRGNISLQHISLPKCEEISPIATFANCSSLQSLQLGYAQFTDGETSTGTWLSGVTGGPWFNENQILDVTLNDYGIKSFQKLKGFPFKYKSLSGSQCAFHLYGAASRPDEYNAEVLHTGEYYSNNAYSQIDIYSDSGISPVHTFVCYKSSDYVSACVNYDCSNDNTIVTSLITATSQVTKTLTSTYSSEDGYAERTVNFEGCRAVGCGGTSDPTRKNMSCVWSVVLGPDITFIPSYAFKYCSELGGGFRYNGNQITSINTDAFAYAWHVPNKISYFNPDGITNISAGAFAYQYYNSSFSFDAPVTRIASTAFTGCYGLRDVYFDSSIQDMLTVTNFPFGLSAGNKSATIWHDTSTSVSYVVKSSSAIYSKVILRLHNCYNDENPFSISVLTPGYSNGNYSVYFGDGSAATSYSSGKCANHVYSKLTGANLTVVNNADEVQSDAAKGEHVIGFSNTLSSFNRNIEIYYYDGNRTTWDDGTGWEQLPITKPKSGFYKWCEVIQNLVPYPPAPDLPVPVPVIE